MIEKIAHWIIAHRRWVYVIILPATLFLIYQIRYVRLYFERDDILPADHSYVKLQHKLDYYFGGTNLVAIGIRVKNGDIFNPVTVEKIFRICNDKLYFLRGVVRERMLSIAALQFSHRWTEVDEIFGVPYHRSKAYEDIVKDILKEENSKERQKKTQGFRDIVKKDSDILKGIVSEDLKSTVIYVDFEWEKDYRYVTEELQKIIKEEEDGNHTFYLAGRLIELGYLHAYVRKMIPLFGVAFSVVFLLLFICFRTWRGVWVPLFGAFIALAWLLGFLGLLRARLDVLTLCVPFLAMAIATSHSVQIIRRYYEEFLKTKDKVKAAATTLEGLIVPALVAILTDGLGFASLALFSIRVLRYMGIVMGLGIVSIFLVVTLLIHCLLATLPAPSVRSAERAMRPGILSSLLHRFAAISLGRNRWVVLAVALIILAIGLVEMQRVEVGFTRPGTLNLWPDSKYNQDEAFLNKYFLGTNDYYIYIGAKQKEDLYNKPKISKVVDKLQQHLTERPDVGATRSYINVVKSQARRHYGGKYEVPDDSRALFEILFGMLGDTDQSKDLIDMDFRQANIQVFMKNREVKNIRDIIRDTEEFIKKANHSDAEIVPAAGIIGLYAAIMDEISEKTLYDTLLITVVIVILCAIGFRSIWGGIAVLLPLGIAKVLTYGIMGYAHEGLFLSTVAIMAPGMGVGVDYAIYTLSRLREEARKKGQDPDKAFVVALTTAGEAVFYTAMSVALGVAILWFSWIRLQAVMGGLLAVVITLNMLAALLILPSLIAVWKPRFIYG